MNQWSSGGKLRGRGSCNPVEEWENWLSAGNHKEEDATAEAAGSHQEEDGNSGQQVRSRQAATAAEYGWQRPALHHGEERSIQGGNNRLEVWFMYRRGDKLGI